MMTATLGSHIVVQLYYRGYLQSVPVPTAASVEENHFKFTL